MPCVESQAEVLFNLLFTLEMLIKVRFARLHTVYIWSEVHTIPRKAMHLALFCYERPPSCARVRRSLPSA